MNNNKKIIKKYLKQLRGYLPTYYSNEKRYIKNMEASIHEVVGETDNLTWEQLISELGEPKENACQYILETDEDTLLKSIQFTKYVKYAFISLFFALFAAITIYWGYCYLYYKEAKESYISREVITIEEITEESE